MKDQLDLEDQQKAWKAAADESYERRMKETSDEIAVLKIMQMTHPYPKEWNARITERIHRHAREINGFPKYPSKIGDVFVTPTVASNPYADNDAKVISEYAQEKNRVAPTPTPSGQGSPTDARATVAVNSLKVSPEVPIASPQTQSPLVPRAVSAAITIPPRTKIPTQGSTSLPGHMTYSEFFSSRILDRNAELQALRQRGGSVPPNLQSISGRQPGAQGSKIGGPG